MVKVLAFFSMLVSLAAYTISFWTLKKIGDSYLPTVGYVEMASLVLLSFGSVFRALPDRWISTRAGKLLAGVFAFGIPGGIASPVALFMVKDADPFTAVVFMAVFIFALLQSKFSYSLIFPRSA